MTHSVETKNVYRLDETLVVIEYDDGHHRWAQCSEPLEENFHEEVEGQEVVIRSGHARIQNDILVIHTNTEGYDWGNIEYRNEFIEYAKKLPKWEKTDDWKFDFE